MKQAKSSTNEQVFTDLYKNLNPEQQAAVDHIDGPLIVLAGAGTGKTQILALRIANILKQTQADPQNILCLTFTETGAAAMRKRLMNIIGTPAYHVTIGTFHSFCNDVIQQYPEYFLFTHDLAPLDDVERIKVFTAVLDDLPVDSTLKPFSAPYFYIRSLSSAVQSLKRENVDVEEYKQLVKDLEHSLTIVAEPIEELLATHARKLTMDNCQAIVDSCRNIEPAVVGKEIQTLFDNSTKPAEFKKALKSYYERWKSQLPKQKELITVYEAYQAKLLERGRYDYEDMLLYVVDAFEKYPELLATYQERYQYILVDEYQDTNGAQNKVVELLGSFFEDPNVFAVGDDKQSIYRFQGASLENILYFTKRYPAAKVINLQSNYRSTQTILDAAASVISHNVRSVQRELALPDTSLQAAAQTGAEPVRVGEFVTSVAEYYWVAQQVKALIANGTSPSEIAILYRNNSDADDLLNVLEYEDIPVYLQAGVNILQDNHVGRLITLLRYLVSYEDNEQLFYILQFDFITKRFGIDTTEVMQAVILANKHNLPLMKVLLGTEESGALGGFSPSEELRALANQLLTWRSISVNEALSRFFEQLLSESGYIEFVLQQPDALEHLNRVNTLYGEMKQLNRADSAMRLTDFIEYLNLLSEHSLYITEQELHTEREAVRLMTAHQAKGLEFEHVFIIRCINGHWGNIPRRVKLDLPAGIIKNDIASDVAEQNEDERRLFYVAITRAKYQLTITYPQQSGSGRSYSPAIFLSEMNSDYVSAIHAEEDSKSEQAIAILQATLLGAKPKDVTQQQREYIADVLANYRISASHVNTYLECPRKFFYQNVLRVAEVKGRAVSYGTAIHNTLRDISQTYNSTKKFLTEKQVLAKYEEHLQREVMQRKDYNDTLEFGTQTLLEYYPAHKELLQHNAFPERSFSGDGVVVTTPNGEVPIIGNIDAITVQDETARTVKVIDYKTGNPDNKASKLSKNGDYYRQLVFYKLLCDNSPNFPFTAVSGEIQFVQPSKKTGEFAHKTYQFSAEEVVAFTEILGDVYTKIKNLEFLEVSNEDACGECEYCRLLG